MCNHDTYSHQDKEILIFSFSTTKILQNGEQYQVKEIILYIAWKFDLVAT